MASEAQDTIWKAFLEIAGSGGEFPGVLGGLAVRGDVTSKAGAQPQKSASVLESVVQTVFESGLGLVPLVGGLLGLFGGGDDPQPAPLLKAALPQRIAFNAAETADGLRSVDYDQAGRLRPYVNEDFSGRPTAPQITVNVQAMDARSFLDRSNDIAAAVREAMLHSNSINDVVSEL